jgi:lipooligosaccharide transport system permease protein
MSMRAGVYGCVPLLVGLFFGLDPAWGMLTVPFIAFVSGFGWANFGIMVAGFSKSIDNFSYIVSAVLTPLFLVAGTFFPLDGLPEWVQVLGLFNPLHHCVELVRNAVFGFEGWEDVARFAYLIAFGLAMWRVAIHAMTRKLID